MSERESAKKAQLKVNTLCEYSLSSLGHRISIVACQRHKTTTYNRHRTKPKPNHANDTVKSKKKLTHTQVEKKTEKRNLCSGYLSYSVSVSISLHIFDKYIEIRYFIPRNYDIQTEVIARTNRSCSNRKPKSSCYKSTFCMWFNIDRPKEQWNCSKKTKCRHLLSTLIY